MFKVPYIFYRVMNAGADGLEDYMRKFESDSEAFNYFAQSRNVPRYVVKCSISEKDGKVNIQKTILAKKIGRRK